MKRLLTLLAATFTAACNYGNNAAGTAPVHPTAKFAANHFLQFFARQPSLAAGHYTLVIAPAASSLSSYTLVVAFDDGTARTFAGSWGNDASADPADPDNPAHAITLAFPGGLSAALTASVAACLYLLDSGGNILARDGDADDSSDACNTGTTTASLFLPASRTNDARYAEAFYATVDPLNERDTLPKWKEANGFGDGFDVHVIFRDTKDLGYGRDMHMRANPVVDDCEGDTGLTQYAFFVHNFQVRSIPGQEYSPFNLDAAIAQDYRYHVGTNAIEWGPVDTDGDGCFEDVDGDMAITQADFFTRHYTFDPGPVETRRLLVNLDGKGPKAMPVPCILCHGGRADPLLPDGTFPRKGDTKARLQPFDVGSFEYAGASGWTRADLEAGLKALNAAVYKSFETNDFRTEPVIDGEWDSSLAREMVESWYGGAGLPDDTFSDSYVPDGWVPDPDTGVPPAGADTLYRELVAKNCRACHLLRGINHENDIDFTSYDKFIGHARQIEDYVFDRGIMPLALITWDNLWDVPATLDLLASMLPGFTRFDGDGNVLEPGRPIAKAGPDRRGPSPVDAVGTASLFAETFTWSIVSTPVGAVASLTNADTARPTLTANQEGNYVLELVVGNATGASDPDSVTITIDSGVSPAPRDITFEAHIKPVMQVGGDACVFCHAPATTVVPPVFWTDAGFEGNDLYQEVRARIDFTDPENSRLLRKPTGNHHNGGVRPGFDLDGDRSNYDLFLNWILEGAREN